MSVVPVHAEGIDDLIGTWISPDGSAKNDYVRDLDGAWITTRMWFNIADEWELVSIGAMYQRPGDDSWMSISSVTGMGSIVLFESVFTFEEDGVVRLSNTAYTTDGEQLLSEEDWQVSDDEIDYSIFEIIDDQRQPMMNGSWKRTD
jgi:hypothetical protein